MAKNKDGENMLNRIKDFDKLVNYIKKLIDCDKSYEIPDFIIEDLCKSLGFHISIATIENNVEEQNIIYNTNLKCNEKKKKIIHTIYPHRHGNSWSLTGYCHKSEKGEKKQKKEGKQK